VISHAGAILRDCNLDVVLGCILDIVILGMVVALL